MTSKDLEKIIYFAAYMITWVDDEARHRDLPSIEAQVSIDRQEIEDRKNVDVDSRAKKLDALHQQEASSLSVQFC